MDSYNNLPVYRKKKPITVIYCILCTLFLAYAVLFNAIPAISFAGFIGLACFAVCYSVLLTKKNIIACIIPPVATGAAVVLISKSGENTMFATVLGLAGIAFGLIFAAALSYCTAKKLSGSVTFAVLSLLSVFSVCATLLFFVADIYGSINVETILAAFDALSAYFKQEMAVQMKSYLSEIEADADMKASLIATGEAMASVIMQIFPAMIAMLGMLYGALIKLLYTPAVKSAQMADTCIYNREWRFMLTPVSAVFFELIFIGNIIMSLFGVNNTVAFALANVETVLMLPFAYIGLRQIRDIIKDKVNSKAASVAIVVAGTFMLLMLTGGLVLTIAALFGASYVNRLTVQKPKG